jgi:hypothetical protein
MGQGFSLQALSAGPGGIDVPELSDLTYEKSMGTARFMKSVRARQQDGVVLVKVVVKPYAMKLDKYRKKIIGILEPYSIIHIELIGNYRGAESTGRHTECPGLRAAYRDRKQRVPCSAISL